MNFYLFRISLSSDIIIHFIDKISLQINKYLFEYFKHKNSSSKLLPVIEYILFYNNNNWIIIKATLSGGDPLYVVHLLYTILV